MHSIDLVIFIVYFIAMLGIGFVFMRKNSSAEDYFVGGRQMSSWHVGLSVVATDVGGGFSIGLGGLGFAMGIAGSWMLFTGLIGAWLSAVVLTPKISKLAQQKGLFTFPQIFTHFYSGKVALVAGIISAIGYLGFTSSQILAGAKLASASFSDLDFTTALIIMGTIAVVYTVMGGIKAVIYTDTVQWIILMGGLIFIGIPIAYHAVGGWETISATLAPEFLSFENVSWQQLVNWAVTIIPIWFVGMTLYQRIYACKNEKEAQKAWFIAGVFEWPLMAFMGVLLGLFARVGLENGLFAGMNLGSIESFDPEMGLPLLLKKVLPVGLMGLMMSAYFSAIMSTADSCLMAASGNIVTDLFGMKHTSANQKKELRVTQLVTLVVGAVAIFIAAQMQDVLELMLYSYAFMVSGLLVPVLGAVLWKKHSAVAATAAMIVGGSTTLVLILIDAKLPLGLDANIFGISGSLVVFVFFTYLFPNKSDFQPVLKTK